MQCREPATVRLTDLQPRPSVCEVPSGHVGPGNRGRIAMRGRDGAKKGRNFKKLPLLPRPITPPRYTGVSALRFKRLGERGRGKYHAGDPDRSPARASLGFVRLLPLALLLLDSRRSRRGGAVCRHRRVDANSGKVLHADQPGRAAPSGLAHQDHDALSAVRADRSRQAPARIRASRSPQHASQQAPSKLGLGRARPSRSRTRSARSSPSRQTTPPSWSPKRSAATRKASPA